MIAFTTWLWGTKYRESHVLKLAAGVARNYSKPYRFVVFADRNLDLPSAIEVKPIANLPLIGRGCFCRLRMFDPAWQGWNNFNDRIVNLDLDVLIVRPIGDLFERPESFMILQGVNAANPCPFNCSVMMLQAGTHAEVWRDFSLERAQAIQFHEFPDDQGWLWHKLPNAAGWKPKESGIYAFQKPGWTPRQSLQLPANARIVAFFGWRKPELFTGLDWVDANWKT